VLPTLPGAMAASSAASPSSSANRSSLIIFSTELDGGSACVGMKNVSQAFTVSNSTSASFDFPPIRLDALLSQSDAAKSSGLDTVTFVNSLYPACLSRATKKSNIAQAPVDSSNSSTTPPVDTKPDSPDDPIVSTLTAAEATTVRDSIIGDYEPVSQAGTVE
jgi:hypothetical protein